MIGRRIFRVLFAHPYWSIPKGYADAILSELRLLPYTDRASRLKAAQRAVNRDWRAYASYLPGYVVALTGIWTVVRRKAHSPGIMMVVAILVAVGIIVSSMLEQRFKRLTRLRHLSRSFPYLCRTCGYDLTGNTSGVCPECDTFVGRTGNL